MLSLLISAVLFQYGDTVSLKSKFINEHARVKFYGCTPESVGTVIGMEKEGIYIVRMYCKNLLDLTVEGTNMVRRKSEKER